MIIDTSRPLASPSGSRNASRWVKMPTITKTASTPIPARTTIGSARGFCLRMIPATMRICLMRPAEAGSAASFGVAAPAGLFAMEGRIRAAGRIRETAAWWLADWARRGSACRGGIRRGPARHRLGVQPARPVGGPDQRPRHHAREPEAERLLAEPLELGRLHPPDHRVVERGRAQVLGDGEQLAPGGPQVGHGLADLGRLLAEAEDEVGLGDQARRPGLGQDLK